MLYAIKTSESKKLLACESLEFAEKVNKSINESSDDIKSKIVEWPYSEGEHILALPKFNVIH